MSCADICTVAMQTYPYNNFEVLDVQRFSSSPMRAFNDAVDASHNIYRHRRAVLLDGSLCGRTPSRHVLHHGRETRQSAAWQA